MGIFVKSEPCPQCRKYGRDKSGDNLARYADGSCYCWSCNYVELSDEEKEKRGINVFNWDESLMSTKEIITQEEIDSIKSNTGVSGKNHRGITDETYKYYSVRFEYDSQSGNVTKHYYPITEDYKAAGYKIRYVPKDFSSIGKIGKVSDLFGQWKFRQSNSKMIVLTSGEVDALSAFQILEDYRKSRNSDFEPTPVVSSIIGESGSHAQIQLQYDWLNRFEKIIVCYDQDEVGKESVKKLAKVLPKGKMYVMELPLKDTNDMLMNGRSKEWITSFFKAKPFTPDGILSSASLMDKIVEAARTPKIPLPPFMWKLQKMMAGGIPLGVIVNLASSSGSGKSTLVEEMLYYWIFNSPYKLGVVTLESDAGQYGTKLLSRHLNNKIDLIEDVEEKINYLESEEVQVKANELWLNPDGTPRWHLIEDRDGGIDSMKKLIDSLIISCECRVIILDPLQDILDGLSNEDQSLFSKWMKGMVKSHGVTFINVNHVRKNSSNQKANSTGSDLHEEDIMGSSTIFKSGACNLMFTRNKEAEDEVERNTTHMKATKVRWSGLTGAAGQYYYDNATHTMYDKDDFFKTRVEF